MDYCLTFPAHTTLRPKGTQCPEGQGHKPAAYMLCYVRRHIIITGSAALSYAEGAFFRLQEYLITSSGQLSTQVPYRIHSEFSMEPLCTILLTSKLIGQFFSHVLHCLHLSLTALVSRFATHQGNNSNIPSSLHQAWLNNSPFSLMPIQRFGKNKIAPRANELCIRSWLFQHLVMLLHIAHEDDFSDHLKSHTQSL